MTRTQFLHDYFIRENTLNGIQCVCYCFTSLNWNKKKKSLTTLYPRLLIITAPAVQFVRLRLRHSVFFLFCFWRTWRQRAVRAHRCHRQHIPRRRQDGRRAVSCFIKDHSTSNYTVTTVWLRGPRAPRGEKKEPIKDEERRVRVQ